MSALERLRIREGDEWSCRGVLLSAMDLEQLRNAFVKLAREVQFQEETNDGLKDELADIESE